MVPRRASQRTEWIVLLGLFLLVIVIYGQVRHHEFVHFDDYEYIVENPHVRAGLSWEGVKWAFGSFHMANWHPLTWLSHMVDCSLFGLEPGGHHMTSVLLHTLNSLLLFAGLRFMTRAPWPSLVVAALFAVHPLRVESVAWVAERKDVLAAFFWMLTMLAYAYYTRLPGLRRYLLVFLCLALGLMAKPMLVTLPIVLLLLDVWPLARLRAQPFRRLLLEKVPLLFLSAASGAVTVLAQRGGGAVETLEAVSFPSRLGNALIAYVVYLGKTIWPAGLAVYYPHPAVVSKNLLLSLAVPALFAGLLLALITYPVARRAKARPYLAVGWLWYLGTLLPVIGLFQVGNQAMADRYAYLPLVGIYIAVVWGARDLIPRWPGLRPLFVVAVPLALLSYSAATWSQTAHWRSSAALFGRALLVTTDNYVAHTNLGNALARRGDLVWAVGEYESALAIRPDFVEAHNNLGGALMRQGDPVRATEHYRHAIRLRPFYDKAHYNLGLALDTQGKPVQAMAHYERALVINPDLAEAHLALGGILLKRGRLRQAVSRYRQALLRKPDLVGAAVALSWLLATSHDPSIRNGKEAVEWAEHSARMLGRTDPDVLDTLGAAYARAGDFSEAVRWQEQAVEMAPTGQKADFRGRLELYRSGKPYHQLPPAVQGSP